MIRALAQAVLSGSARSADVKALANAALAVETRLAEILDQAQQHIGAPELDANGQPTASHDARIGFARGALACCEAFAGGPPRPMSDAELQSVLDAPELGPPRQEATGRGFDGPEDAIGAIARSIEYMRNGGKLYSLDEAKAEVARRRAARLADLPTVDLEFRFVSPDYADLLQVSAFKSCGSPCRGWGEEDGDQ